MAKKRDRARVSHTHWCIRLVDDPDYYWSHDFGWTEFNDDVDVFTSVERAAFALPIGGEWVEVMPKAVS